MRQTPRRESHTLHKQDIVNFKRSMKSDLARSDWNRFFALITHYTLLDCISIQFVNQIIIQIKIKIKKAGTYCHLCRSEKKKRSKFTKFEYTFLHFKKGINKYLWMHVRLTHYDKTSFKKAKRLTKKKKIANIKLSILNVINAIPFIIVKR